MGGAIRDALLGHPHLDWDLATSATPDAGARAVRRAPNDPGRNRIRHGRRARPRRQDARGHDLPSRRADRRPPRRSRVRCVARRRPRAARFHDQRHRVFAAPRRDPRSVRRTARISRRSSFARSATRTRACARIGCARCARFGSRHASAFAIDDATRARDRRERAVPRPAVAGAREAGARQDDGAGALGRAIALRDVAVDGRVRDAHPGAGERVGARRCRFPTFSRSPGRRRVRRVARCGSPGLLASLDARGGREGHDRAAQLDAPRFRLVASAGRAMGSDSAPRSASDSPRDADAMPTCGDGSRGIGRLQVGRVHASRVGAMVGGPRARANGRRSGADDSVRTLYRRMLRSAFRDPIDLGVAWRSMAMILRARRHPPGSGARKNSSGAARAGDRRSRRETRRTGYCERPAVLDDRFRLESETIATGLGRGATCSFAGDNPRRRSGADFA